MAEKDRNMQIIKDGKALFEDHKVELIDAGLEGQYFLAKDGVFSTYETMSEALAHGYRRFGVSESFLVEQILPVEPVITMFLPTFVEESA